MSPQFTDFLVRFGPALYVIGFLAFLAIPVALLMIRNELAKINEHLRVQQVVENVRAVEERGRS